MYLEKLEPSSFEEFQYLKEQLLPYFPVLKDLEYDPGNVLNQIVELVGVSKKDFEKTILSISSEQVDRYQKLTLMLFRLGLWADSKRLEEITGLPLRQFEMRHLATMRTAWVIGVITELILTALGIVFLFWLLHPLVADVILIIYILTGKGLPAARRILRAVVNVIGESDKRWNT